MSVINQYNGYDKNYINGNNKYSGKEYDCPCDTTVKNVKLNESDNFDAINFNHDKTETENHGIDA